VWIITAWQGITPKVTLKVFKKCCVFSALYETDGDMLWNDSEEDGIVRSECEGDDGTDCEDGNGDTVW